MEIKMEEAKVGLESAAKAVEPAILTGEEKTGATQVSYASDAEVDAAMEKIFERHDRLFSELAK